MLPGSRTCRNPLVLLTLVITLQMVAIGNYVEKEHLMNECNSSLQLFFTAPKLKHEGSAEAQIRRHLYAEMELWTKQQATHGLLMEQLM